MYDITVIGAGWAGFTAAVKAKSLGKSVALIEESQVGGTCLNAGCIAGKTLIQSSRVLEEIKKAKTFGIQLSGSFHADLVQIQSRKTGVIETLRKAMESRLTGIDLFRGKAQIRADGSISILDKKIETAHILLATGSRPTELKGLAFDGEKILSSDHILGLSHVPQSLLIIGGGVIGCEFAALFAALGSRVTVVEIMDQLLPGEDRDIAKKIEGNFKKKSITVMVNTDARTVDLAAFEKVLVSVGRKPRVEGLKESGITVNAQGIEVDEYLRTNRTNVYAAGDCTAKRMLAHFASYQGSVAVNNIIYPQAKQKADNILIPNCIFTHPEIASVGLTEDAAKKDNIQITVHRFDFLGSGMARIVDETDGFIKIIADQKDSRLLGAALIGPKVTELIATLTVAISAKLTVHQLKNIVFAHPSLSEAIVEAL